MAKLPLGTNTHIDSSAECSNEQPDIRKEIGQISKKSVREIEARNKDIQQLENSIKDLHDSFKTMLTLTQDQVCYIPYVRTKDKVFFRLNTLISG